MRENKGNDSLLTASKTVDFLIIGAGIIGLSLARELSKRFSTASIAILEKEKEIGLHASGRNSGVLHSGIYYPENSLKAKFCSAGAKAMTDYCAEFNLPFVRTGKIIVAAPTQGQDLLTLLYRRALNNGAQVELINDLDLKKLEPAVTLSEKALYSPQTAVIDPKSILTRLQKELFSKNIPIYFNTAANIDTHRKLVSSKDITLAYGHMFNTAGVFADKVAALCGLENRYTMVPFKGLYYKLTPTSSIKINHLIYPVPDLNMPFLGIHFTKDVYGSVYVGPTAIPALGRENYNGLHGVKLQDVSSSLRNLGKLYLNNQQNFRTYAHRETARFIKSRFTAAARKLVPQIQSNDLIKARKVGIRAQLFDTKKKELVMDFLVKKSENETHVLNAVSPAFTSAFSFASYLVEQL